MEAFPGFGISGYRSLSGEVQWIPLDPGITVFLGGNNSGKSNVLRILHLHMGEISRSLITAQGLAGFNPRLDNPRGQAPGLKVLWPLDTEAIRGSPEYAAARHDLERLLELPELNRFGVTALPFESTSLEGALEIASTLATALMETTVGGINWGDASRELTGTQGGRPTPSTGDPRAPRRLPRA
jgi:hypothetical protein